LNRGVGGIGAASFFSDVGHEIPTALLPSFLTSTLGASASALGLIEGISDGLAGGARIVGGALADDPERRRAVAVGGYTTTAALGALVGAASSVAQVAVLRAGSWLPRGLRVPARNALLADLAPPEVYGRAYGFERTMDNLGAIVGPLLALLLVSLVGTREAIYLSIIPGLLAALAIVYAIRNTKTVKRTKRTPIRIRIRPVLQGRLRPLMGGITAFEVGNVAATLLILRATDLLEPGRSHDGAVQLAIALYIADNVAATLSSYPAGHVSDRIVATRAMLLGVALFGLAYAGVRDQHQLGRPARGLVRARRTRYRLRRDGRARRRRQRRTDRTARLRVRTPRGRPELRQPRGQRSRTDHLERDLTHRRVRVPHSVDGDRRRAVRACAFARTCRPFANYN
jgi:MFS family permease